MQENQSTNISEQEFALSNNENRIINNLRDRGCAIAVFLPQELKLVDRASVEQAMVIAGNDHIVST